MTVKKTGWRRKPTSRAVTFEEAQGKQMWATLHNGTAFYTKTEQPKLDSNNDEYEQDQEDGPDVKFYFPMFTTQGSVSFELDLTSLTTDEYINLRKLLGKALIEAEPIIKKRDADARQKVERGQIATSRAYRSVSRLFNTEGEVK